MSKESGQSDQPRRFSVDARVTVSSGEIRAVDVRVDGTRRRIMVPVKLFTHFTEQFVRSKPSDGFEKRYKTLMKLLEAAYKQGVADVRRLLICERCQVQQSAGSQPEHLLRAESTIGSVSSSFPRWQPAFATTGPPVSSPARCSPLLRPASQS